MIWLILGKCLGNRYTLALIDTIVLSSLCSVLVLLFRPDIAPSHVDAVETSELILLGPMN